MKSRVAAVLCLVSLVAVCGVAGAGPIDNEDGAFSIASGVSEQETAAVPPARVEKTGQTTSYGTRDDGKLQKGVTWPNPRFTDNGNGTVRDNLTGLIWLKDAGCTKFFATDKIGYNARRNWGQALTAANMLRSGYCGLTDGSVAGNWRLPNVKELQSLIDFKFYDPALPNTAGTGQWTEDDPFLGVESSRSGPFWSSTTVTFDTEFPWVVSLTTGSTLNLPLFQPRVIHVWPVRGPQ